VCDGKIFLLVFWSAPPRVVQSLHPQKETAASERRTAASDPPLT